MAPVAVRFVTGAIASVGGVGEFKMYTAGELSITDRYVASVVGSTASAPSSISPYGVERRASIVATRAFDQIV